MATAEVSLKPVNDLDVQTKGTMKALVYHGPGKLRGRTSRALPSSIRVMPLCGLPPRRFVAPIFTSSKVIFRRLPMDAFWAMRALGSSSR